MTQHRSTPRCNEPFTVLLPDRWAGVKVREGGQGDAQWRLVGNAHEAVAVVGPDLTISHVLVGFAQIWGYSAEELIGTWVVELLHTEDSEAINECWRSALVDPRTVVSCNARTQATNASWRWVERTSAVPSESPELDGVM